METLSRANKLDALSYIGNNDLLKSEFSFKFYSHPQLIKQIDDKTIRISTEDNDIRRTLQNRFSGARGRRPTKISFFVFLHRTFLLNYINQYVKVSSRGIYVTFFVLL